jgi:hypothetical protein
MVCGSQYCKVRGMLDEKGNKLKKAGPSVAVTLLGFKEVACTLSSTHTPHLCDPKYAFAMFARCDSNHASPIAGGSG